MKSPVRIITPAAIVFISIALLTAYFSVLRGFLPAEVSTLLETILLITLLLVLVLGALIALINGTRVWIFKSPHLNKSQFGGQMIFVVVILVILAAFLLGSQW